MNMLYSTDWFSGHEPLWARELGPLCGQKVDYLEVGVYEGRSGVWMLQNILTHPKSTYTGIDPWLHAQRGSGTTPDEVEQRARQNLLRAGGEKVRLIKDSSFNALPRLTSESFDIVYVDGDHRAANVLFDSCECWRLLRPKGLLIWDDYGGAEGQPPECRPATAIDAFLSCYIGQFVSVWQGYQVVIRKTARNSIPVHQPAQSQSVDGCFK